VTLSDDDDDDDDVIIHKYEVFVQNARWSRKQRTLIIRHLIIL